MKYVLITIIFGLIEGFSSVEDVALYMRAFTSTHDWNEMAIDSPDQYICSKDGNVFDGSNTVGLFNTSMLILQDSTYVEGLILLHKKDIAVGTNDYYSYNLPSADLGEEYKPLTLHLYLSEATPIPSTTAIDTEFLTKIHSVTELEPLPFNLLTETNYSYYATIDFITPSGNVVESLFRRIYPQNESGTVIISVDTLVGDVNSKGILDKLGPGVSTIRIQITETQYYKASPIILVPLEIRPANWIKFGEKNSEISLIDPFVSAWGTAYNNDEEMPFESS